MKKQFLHVPDDELLLHAEEERCAASGAQISTHLGACSRCRARLAELESALAKFDQAHREMWEAELPTASVSRALLKARLAELSERERANHWWQSWVPAVGRRETAVLAGLALAACLVLALRLQAPMHERQPVTAALGNGERPDLRLTPGATIPVTEGELCAADAPRAIPAVPVSLKRKVFERYGVMTQKPDAYEVDYLITPELGGATDIRNLWPEPYADTVWNARVKDQLEDRLHRMVCHGDLALATAQRDISTDWIAAYRKYFHVDRPVAGDSSFDFSSLRRSLPRT